LAQRRDKDWVSELEQEKYKQQQASHKQEKHKGSKKHSTEIARTADEFPWR